MRAALLMLAIVAAMSAGAASLTGYTTSTAFAPTSALHGAVK